MMLLPSGVICVLPAFALSRGSGLGRRLLAVALWMNAELVPVGFGEIHAVVLRGLLDIREGELPIGVGYVDDLIESRHSVADVLGISQGFLPLVRIGKDTVRQVAARRELPVLFVRFPGGQDVGHVTLLLAAPVPARGAAAR